VENEFLTVFVFTKQAENRFLMIFVNHFIVKNEFWGIFVITKMGKNDILAVFEFYNGALNFEIESSVFILGGFFLDILKKLFVGLGE